MRKLLTLDKLILRYRVRYQSFQTIESITKYRNKTPTQAPRLEVVILVVVVVVVVIIIIIIFIIIIRCSSLFF